jgi:hypothetical protein
LHATEVVRKDLQRFFAPREAGLRRQRRKARKSYVFAYWRHVFAVEEGAIPAFNGIYFWRLRIPVSASTKVDANCS